jgi:hypothetical protein
MNLNSQGLTLIGQESFVHFLDELEKRGIRWITNTGWSLEAQAELLETSGVRSAPAMLIGQGGMSLGRFRAGRLVRNRGHDKRMQALVRSFRTRVWPQVRSIFIEILKADLVEKTDLDNPFADFHVIEISHSEPAGKY